MSDLSKFDHNQKLNENTSKVSSPILEKLKEFVREKHYLFDYYHRHKNIQRQSKFKIIWNTIINYFWRNKFQKILTFIILICFSILLIEAFTKSIDDVFIAIVFLTWFILWCIQAVLYQIPYYKEMWEDINTPTKIIDLAEEYDPSNHLKFIKYIANNNTVRDIKREEQRFKIVIISQARAKNIVNSAIPIISFVFVVFVLVIFGIPQNWGNSLEIATIAGFGIIPFITISLSFFIELVSKNLIIYQHCLFILQEALIIAEEREYHQKYISVNNINEKYELILKELQNIAKETKSSQKKSSINKNTKKGSLMEELMKIKTIEAPEDFSTNFDSYMSGDKGARRDIH